MMDEVYHRPFFNKLLNNLKLFENYFYGLNDLDR